MLRNILLLTLTCFFTSALHAQAPNWTWAKSGGGTSDETPMDVATDKNGNVYVLGNFRSPSITFGSITLNNADPYTYDMFIVKYNAAGGVVWARSAAGSAEDYAARMGVDTAGNIYVTGYFSSPSITFGSITLTNAGISDIFITKYDPSGNVLWAKRAGSTDADWSRGIAVDGSGNSYITGFFVSPSVTFGTTTLTQSGSGDILIVKYDAAGNVVWAKKEGGTGQDGGQNVGLDGNGNVYVIAEYQDAPLTVGTTTLPSIGMRDLALIKYTAAGSLVWVKSAGGTATETAYDITADASGNSYITGYFDSPTITFGSTTLTNTGNSDFFLAKYDAAGNPAWARSATGRSYDFCYGVAVNNSGTTYITGLFNSDTLRFGTTTLVSAGGSDVFFASYDAAGNLAWAKSIGGPNHDNGLAITVDSANICYATGDFGGPSVSFNSTVLTNVSGDFHKDVYLAKLGACAVSPSAPAAISGNTTPCAGSVLTYSVPVVTGATSYSWAIPAGWAGTSTTNSITVTVGTTSGNITVAAVNACGASTSQALSVSALAVPAQPTAITGDTAVCAGTANTFLIASVPGAASYLWTIPAGWTGTSTTGSINATAGATGGNITVAAVNVCGTGVARSLPVSVNPTPTVSITRSGSTLRATPGFVTYQWYMNGSPVPGAMNDTLVIARDGNYSVLVTNSNHCMAVSNIVVVSLGVAAMPGGNALSVYPNPVKDVLHLKAGSTPPGLVQLTDCLGRTVAELDCSGNAPRKEWQLNIQHLPVGLYLLKGDGINMKVVKE